MLATLATASAGTITEPPDAIILTAEDVGGNRREPAEMRRRIASKKVQPGDFVVRLPGKPGQKPGFRNPHAMAIAFLYPYAEEMQATEGGITTIAADLELFPDAAAAETAPTSPENTTAEELESRLADAPGIDSAEVEIAFVDEFPAASRLAAYRLTYRMGGSPVFEYRVRMRSQRHPIRTAHQTFPQSWKGSFPQGRQGCQEARYAAGVLD